MKGPIACRNENCGGECGLKSIYSYGDDAVHDSIPSDEEAREFARAKNLDVEHAVTANRGRA